jgi:hypothetical protein
MNLVEVMVAGAVFALAVGASAHLWAAAATANQQGEWRQSQLQAIERDRLQLQAAWSSQPPQVSCAVALQQMQGLAAQRPAGAGWSRRLALSPEGDLLHVQWSSSDGVLQRQRLYAPAALGLCDGASEAAG